MNLAGEAAERTAQRYLETRGLNCLARNMQCRRGEIDLIMQDQQELVFIEVRARRQGATVDAMASVTAQKQQRIIQASRYWLARNPKWFEHPIRFDVIAIDGDNLHWEQNAFDAEQ